MYSDVVLPDGESTHPRAKDYIFSSMCCFPEKYIKFLNVSSVLNCFSEYPGVFVPNVEINYEDDVNLPFI